MGLIKFLKKVKSEVVLTKKDLAQSIKKETEELQQKKKYTVKESYNESNLCVANIIYISNECKDCKEEFSKCKTTEQKYIFEIIEDGIIVRFREVFTGIVMNIASYGLQSNTPYITNLKPLTDYFPDVRDKDIKKLDMILKLDQINHIDTLNKCKKLSK